jgi:hypothetical protein
VFLSRRDGDDARSDSSVTNASTEGQRTVVGQFSGAITETGGVLPAGSLTQLAVDDPIGDARLHPARDYSSSIF